MKWKWIKGYKGYYKVSDTGKVRSVDREVTASYGSTQIRIGRILRPNRDKRGYRRVALCKHGVQQSFQIHRLVLITFVGLCPKGMEAIHKDGNPSNNKLSNLKWGTKLENCKDTIKHRHENGQLVHWNAKLSPNRVRRLREMYFSGMYLQHELSKIFDLPQSTISGIITYRTWKHI